MRDQLICYLDISNWHFSIGAEHYYGHLIGYDKDGKYQKIELLHPLTAKEALYLNKKNGSRMYCLLKKGDKDGRFETEAQVIRYALKEYKKHFSEATVLLEGDSCSCGPKRCIVGPEWFKRIMNQLYQMEEEAGKTFGWNSEKSWKVREPLSKLAGKIIKELYAQHERELTSAKNPSE